MIVCSCTVISDQDIEAALVDILNEANAPIPTPGVVYRHLQKRMNCCGCAPLAVETIYNKVDELERKGLIPSSVGASTRSKLLAFSARHPVRRISVPSVSEVAVSAQDPSRKVA